MRALLFFMAVSCLVVLSYGAPAQVNKRDVGYMNEEQAQVNIDDDESFDDSDEEDEWLEEFDEGDSSSSEEEWEDEDQELDKWLSEGNNQQGDNLEDVLEEDLKEIKEELEEEKDEIEEEIEEIEEEIEEEEAEKREMQGASQNVVEGGEIPWNDVVDDVAQTQENKNILDQFENLMENQQQGKRKRL